MNNYPKYTIIMRGYTLEQSDAIIQAMEGLEDKFAVEMTMNTPNCVENIKQLLEKAQESIEDITYIIPHQSNQKIMKAIASRLKMQEEKMYTNIEKIGNTFCASIPIAIDEMLRKNLLKQGEKVILLGYGGGLNTGSILLET